jgi:hypothetical protein
VVINTNVRTAITAIAAPATALNTAGWRYQGIDSGITIVRDGSALSQRCKIGAIRIRKIRDRTVGNIKVGIKVVQKSVPRWNVDPKIRRLIADSPNNIRPAKESPSSARPIQGILRRDGMLLYRA